MTLADTLRRLAELTSEELRKSTLLAAAEVCESLAYEAQELRERLAQIDEDSYATRTEECLTAEGQP